MTAEKAVTVRGLSFSVGNARILRSVSFSVEAGGFLCIVGPNGAGKSTLLKCAGGLIRGWRGDVRLFGEPVASMTPRAAARRIAWVHQGSGEGLFYTVRQFASMSRFALRPVLGGESAEERAAVDAALETAGVASLAERRLCALSGGERQRAFIAAALAQETDILFLDEPTSYLDYRHQAEAAALIGRLNKKEGKTVVMVTHDVNLALHGADEILAVKDGRSVWQGLPEDLIYGGKLSEIFGTEFELFSSAAGRMLYAVPKGLAG